MVSNYLFASGFNFAIPAGISLGLSVAALAAADTVLGQLTLSFAQDSSPLAPIASTTQVGQVVTLNLDFDAAALAMTGSGFGLWYLA